MLEYYYDTPDVLGGVGGPVVLFYDQLNDTDGVALESHTPAPINTPGASWSVDSATADIQGNALNIASVTFLGKADIGVSDYTLICPVKLTAGANTGIVFRYSDSTHYWLLQLNETGDAFELYRNNGGFTLIDSVSVPLTNGVWYTVQIVLLGTSIVATLDGGNTLSQTSSFNQAATKIGARSATAISSRIEEFKVTVP